MIKFKNVKFKNFGSFGNYFTSIDLESNNMTLVTGSNGHGKSYALLDSITFALFGKPFRKINIPQLVNSINKKDCIVELSFSIGSDNYKIIRGLRPKKFEIYKNDELIDQNAKTKEYQKNLEEQIIKMNYKSFTQIVTLGSSSFIPFMQLTPADRREVIEDILDINIFSVMNVLIKSRLSTIKERTTDLNKNIEIVKEKIKIQEQNIFSMKKRKKESIEKNKDSIVEIQNQMKILLSDISTLEKKISNLDQILEEKNKKKSKVEKHDNLIKQLKNKIKDLNSSFVFYDENETCPTCSQNIDELVKSKKKNEILSKKEEVEIAISNLTETINSFKNDLDSIEDNLKEIKKSEQKLNEKKTSVVAAEKYLEKLEKDFCDKDVFDDEIEKTENVKREYDEDLQKNTEKLNDHNEKKKLLEILFLMLKDSGIKSKIIKNYLPIMNEIINKYLNKMNFFVSFSLDEEFNEEIKSRHRDTFSYMNFSEGEKSRIDLAILLSWREIAKIKNSVNCNLLILDEIFDSSMDSMGADDLMKVLKDLSVTNNIFVITHKSDQLGDKFNKTISFKKKNNFSRLISK